MKTTRYQEEKNTSKSSKSSKSSKIKSKNSSRVYKNLPNKKKNLQISH